MKKGSDVKKKREYFFSFWWYCDNGMAFCPAMWGCLRRLQFAIGLEWDGMGLSDYHHHLHIYFAVHLSEMIIQCLRLLVPWIGWHCSWISIWW